MAPGGIPQPDLRPFGENGRYRLEQTYRLPHGRPARLFVIPAGFECDGASVPRWAWTISGLRPDGLIRAGALVHDALYRHQGALPRGWVVPHRLYTRAESDVIFYEINRRAGLGRVKSWLAYKAVRIGGRRSWRQRAP